MMTCEPNSQNWQIAQDGPSHIVILKLLLSAEIDEFLHSKIIHFRVSLSLDADGADCI